MDLDLRKLRYFVAVADTLHFGRAAEQLHIAQPVLSRQIRALEQDLGTALFTRDSHGVTLTDAGTQLLTDAAPLLASADAARRRVTAAARGDRRMMVGFRAGVAVTPAIHRFAVRHPDVRVDVQRIEADEQAEMLLDGRIDIGYVRLPLDEAGLLWHADASTQPTRRPHLNAGYLVRGVDETLEHVAAGRGISFLARSATVFYTHPEVAYVPVPDLAPDQVCLAMATSHASPVVDDFFAAAQAAAEITAECGNHEMWQLGGDPLTQDR
jgi:DNA-binding transcriptional LysR family regulator